MGNTTYVLSELEIRPVFLSSWSMFKHLLETKLTPITGFRSKIEASGGADKKRKKKGIKMLESCLSLDPGVFEFEEHALFDTDEPVWILGKQYSARQDFDEVKNDIKSRLWFTYRKGFQPIGGVGPSSDGGWGCMLRCGQMMLAQTLLCKHKGREWRWDFAEKDQIYLNILRLFQDKKHRLYSIHQIAQMGVSEGKKVGQWFGPNTAAQVLKKLSIYDHWTSLAVHVAMDSAVVIEDIRILCKTPPKPPTRKSGGTQSDEIEPPTRKSAGATQSDEIGQSGLLTDPPSLSPQGLPPLNSAGWRPLLLIVPLRLGLATLNPCYVSALKLFFSLPECIGVIGGRPNHALYFIGVVGEDLIYLDPHNSQNFVDLDVPREEVDDSTYHSPFILHIPITSVDPSLALGFLCLTEADFDNFCSSMRQVDDSTCHSPFILHIPITSVDSSLALGFLCLTEADFDNFCSSIRQTFLNSSTPPLFELLDKRPRSWPKFVPYAGEETSKLPEFTVLDPRYDSDEEFEILDEVE